MNAVPVPLKRHQSFSATAVSSGPLSQRRDSGRGPGEHDPVELVDGLVGVDAALALPRQRLAGELVNAGQALSRNFRTTCSGVCLLAFIAVLLWPIPDR